MTLLEKVKHAAIGRWLELLVELGGLHPEQLNGRHHPCPKCGGTDRFRMIDPNAGALFCQQCFSEKNGDGIAALQWLRGEDFKTVLQLLANRLNVQEDEPRRPRCDQDLEPVPWNSALAELWVRRKPGITSQAVMDNGGDFFRWRKRSTVIALPVHGKDGQLVGRVMWNSDGEPFRRKKGGPTAKVLLTRFSKSGWIGKHALDHLAEAELVWKVEGPSDMLALYAAIPPDLHATHLAFSNGCGGSENPTHDLVERLRGKNVIVVGDNDPTGEVSVRKWTTALRQVCASVSVAKVPATKGEAPCKDVRDYLAAGGTYAELLGLAIPVTEDAPTLVINAGTPQANGAGQAEANQESDEPEDEADDDPSRLGREYVRQRRGRIACFLDEVYRWRDNRWAIVPDGDLRQDLYPWVLREYQRVLREKKERQKNVDAEPPRAHKITRAQVSSVMDAIKGYCGVPSSARWGAELEPPDSLGRMDRVAAQRRWIAVENGILDVDAILNSEGNILIDHTPTWWSPHCLPYIFDPTAGSAHRPNWESFLEKNLEADDERIAILQEWAGYCLIPDTSRQRFLMCEGDGANGKGVYLAVLHALLGELNVSNVHLELFGERFALEPTVGKLANIISEVGDLDKVAEGILKAFVVGDPLTLDRKNRSAITIRPTARITIATNNRPRFVDKSDGIFRRMILMPFQVEIPEGERVLGMDEPAWWRRSGEMPAILNWALEGLQRLTIQGTFTKSRICGEAVGEYKTELNPAKQFLDDHYELAPARTPCREVYKLYSKWCEEGGYRPLGESQFGKEVYRVFKVRRSRMRAPVALGDGPRGRSWTYDGIAEKVVENEL